MVAFFLNPKGRCKPRPRTAQASSLSSPCPPLRPLSRGGPGALHLQHQRRDAQQDQGCRDLFQLQVRVVVRLRRHLLPLNGGTALPTGWVWSGVLPGAPPGLLPGLRGRRTLDAHPGPAHSTALHPQKVSLSYLPVRAPSGASQGPAPALASTSLPTPGALVAVSRADPAGSKARPPAVSSLLSPHRRARG